MATGSNVQERPVCTECVAGCSVVEVTLLPINLHQHFPRLIRSGGDQRVACTTLGRSRDHGRLHGVEVLAGGAGNTWHMFDQGGDWREMTWSTKKTKTVTENTTCLLENCGRGTWSTGWFHWSEGLSNFQCHLKRAIQRCISSALNCSRGIKLLN